MTFFPWKKGPKTHEQNETMQLEVANIKNRPASHNFIILRLFFQLHVSACNGLKKLAVKLG